MTAESGRAFEFETITGWFTGRIELEPGQMITLQARKGLEAAIAERVFYETFVVAGLNGIYETQAELLNILDKNKAQP